MANLYTNKYVDDRLEGRNILRLSDVTSATTKTHFKCTAEGCGREWVIQVDHVVHKGRGCYRCSKNEPLDNSRVDALLSGRDVIRIGDYVNAHTKILFRCTKISCGYMWESSPNNTVRKRQGCPKCAGHIKLTEEIVDERLKLRPLKRLGIIDGNARKTLFRCLHESCGNEWMGIPSSILDGGGCPSCAKYGFKISLPATVYTYTINDIYCGYGISNDFEQRDSQHQKAFKKHNANAELIATYECSGIQAQQIERLIQKTFPIVNTGIEGFKKEATHLHNLPAVLNLISNSLDNPI